MSKTQLLVQYLELLFNHAYAQVSSVLDLSDIHASCLIFLVKTKPLTGRGLS